MAAFVALIAAGSSPVMTADDLLARTRAAYKALRSYADTGTVLVESQSPGAALTTERHTFATNYRAPRHFLFDFKGDPNAGGDRVVVWSDGTDFQSWWSSTQVHERYPKGQGATAFGTTSFPTKGAVIQIPSLLFADAELHSPLTDAKDLKTGGSETVAGRPCTKVTAIVQGHFGAARPTTFWIDTETLLVRKMLEDSPQGATAGTIERVTTTFQPQANPQLEESRFRFTPPTR